MTEESAVQYAFVTVERKVPREDSYNGAIFRASVPIEVGEGTNSRDFLDRLDVTFNDLKLEVLAAAQIEYEVSELGVVTEKPTVSSPPAKSKAKSSGGASPRPQPADDVPVCPKNASHGRMFDNRAEARPKNEERAAERAASGSDFPKDLPVFKCRKYKAPENCNGAIWDEEPF